jgi:ketosteroid isomerase-like protein
MMACPGRSASSWRQHGIRGRVPWLAARTGREEVAGFFEALGALEIHDFAPTAVLGDGDVMVALIDIDMTVGETGERVRDAEAHVWTFGRDGRVAEFRHVVDTVKHVEALHVRAPA